MKTAVVDFDILTYWHAGTGKGAGPEADALVFRTPAGLPCLPGRTVKGLLRDAVDLAVLAGLVPAADVIAWFGTDIPPQRADDEREAALEAMRFSTRPGSLRFESALIVDGNDGPDVWEDWAMAHPLEVAHLFERVSSTALDDGVARGRTLRTIEVAVPMKLSARVDGPDDGAWVDGLKKAAMFLDAIGSHRNRGLGRVKVEVRA